MTSFFRRWLMKQFSKPNLNQDNIPPILKLPPEILDYCWQYLGRSDIFRVSRVCLVFWHTSRNRIFQSLTINISSPPILLLNPKLVLRSPNKSSKTLKHAIARLTNFYSDPAACELWNIVQAWTVTAALGTLFLVHLKENEQNFTQQYLSTIFQFLSCSRNLRSLDLARLDLRREHWVILEGLPALETLRLVSCFFSPSSSSHLERLKLKELEITGTSFGSRSIDGSLVFRLCNPAYLEKLTLNDPLVTHIVLASLSSLGCFPHLTYLNVFVNTVSGGDFLRFLAAIPSLTTLRMFPYSAYIMPDHPLPALPFLRSYKGSPHLLSHVVPGRPVDHVCLDLQVVKAPEDGGQLDDYTIHTDLVSTVLDISRSIVPVKTLKIESFLPALQLFTAIAQHLSDLHCLDLVLIGTPPLENLVTSPGSRFEDLDDNPLDASETIRGLAAGRAPLPPKLQTFRLSYSPGWSDNAQGLEGIQQREIVYCLYDRYPSLREVQMGYCRWWREGAHWSREICDFEET